MSHRYLTAAALAWLVLACSERREPPGASASASAGAEQLVSAPGAAVPEADAPARAPARDVLGTERDNLPFKPDGTKLAAIAWRNWVYTDTGSKRTRYGYLRAGAVVDARGPAIKNDGCDEGWYRINPRGFVCIGKGATLDLDHPVVKASSVRAVRGQSLPYLYAMANDVAPLRYFRLPTARDMQTVEGDGVKGHIAAWKERTRLDGRAALLGELSGPPDFLANRQELKKPYGTTKHLHFLLHAGRASPDSGFAIQRVFEWEGRVFGLTTELDLIALDRTRVVKPSSFVGVKLEADQGLPVGFITSHSVQRFEAPDAGPLTPSGNFSHREGVRLTGKTRAGAGTYYETAEGFFVPGEAMRIIPARDTFPSFATGTRKWIDISIRDQSLVAYVGRRPVYVTLVSTGRGGLGDPEKVHATVRGTFMVHSKHVSSTMDGEDDVTDNYNLLDVPFVQYFHKGYALHGTYWHDEFGKVRSHGCINLAPADAAWLFEWTDPAVPPGWHSVLNKDRGTVVHVRP